MDARPHPVAAVARWSLPCNPPGVWHRRVAQVGQRNGAKRSRVDHLTVAHRRDSRSGKRADRSDKPCLSAVESVVVRKTRRA